MNMILGKFVNLCNLECTSFDAILPSENCNNNIHLLHKYNDIVTKVIARDTDKLCDAFCSTTYTICHKNYIVTRCNLLCFGVILIKYCVIKKYKNV